MSEGQAYCHRCGSLLPRESTFCPKCGTPVAGAQSAGLAQPVAKRKNETGEKDEKKEKNEKGEKAEKGSQRGGYIGAVIGGLVLVWFGISFFLQENSYLPSNTWWAYFLVGLGLILVFDGLLRYAEGRYGLGPIIGGAVVAAIGISSIAQLEWNVKAELWPFVFIAIGVVVLVGGITARGRVRNP